MCAPLKWVLDSFIDTNFKMLNKMSIEDTTQYISSVVDAPPSFCDMGNAIRSLIVQASGGGQGEKEECVLLSEEHSLVLTCCWVSLKVKQNEIHLPAAR